MWGIAGEEAETPRDDTALALKLQKREQSSALQRNRALANRGCHPTETWLGMKAGSVAAAWSEVDFQLGGFGDLRS